MTKAIDDILETVGFQVKRWQSNGELDHVNNEKDVKDINVPQGKQDEKVLGLLRNNKEDVLKYKVEVKANKTQQPKFTERNILSQVARIYDPIGFAVPYMARAKIGLQELWKEGLDWDHELSPKDQMKWSSFTKYHWKDVCVQLCLLNRRHCESSQMLRMEPLGYVHTSEAKNLREQLTLDSL